MKLSSNPLLSFTYKSEGASMSMTVRASFTDENIFSISMNVMSYRKY